MAQTRQINGETWVLDGNRWVRKSVVDEWARRGIDLLNDPNPTAEMEAARNDNSMERSAGTVAGFIEKNRPQGKGQKAYRGGLQGEYGKEQGNRIFDQHVAWAREAEQMGASPEMQDFLYFQEGVLLPGGLVADYTTLGNGEGGLRVVDLQGNPVPVTPELEQQAKAKHIEVYGSKYGGTQTPTAPPPAAPPPTPAPASPSRVATPQMPGPTPPPVPLQAAAPGATPTGTPAGTTSQGQQSGMRPPSPSAPPPATHPAAGPRSPYPGATAAAQSAPRLSEQPGLGGAAAPAPASATQPAASSTTPAAPGKPSGSVAPVKPGLATAATPTQPGIGVPAQPPQPPAGTPGQGGAGAATPPAAPPPARSPYPASQPPAQVQAAAPAAPYPGMPPSRPPRTVALPGSLAQYNVPMPQLAEGQHFFDPFSGKWV